MLFHHISPSDVHPGDHLYRWRNRKRLQGIAVQTNTDTSEISVVVTSKGLNTFHLVTLTEFKGRGILRRAYYDQSDNYLHRIKLSGTSFVEKRVPVKEIVQNALLLFDITNRNPGCIEEIFVNNFAKLCCTIKHELWCSKLRGNDNKFEQVSHLISPAPFDEHKVQELENKIEALEDEHFCSICMERPNNVAFLCGHLACCECSHGLTTCHICRRDINQKIQLFRC